MMLEALDVERDQEPDGVWVHAELECAVDAVFAEEASALEEVSEPHGEQLHSQGSIPGCILL